MSHRSLKVVVLGLVLVGGWAFAPTALADKKSGGGSGRQFQMMDGNNDGKVSESEHAAGAKKMFEMMDADKNGMVSAAEMEAAHGHVTGRSSANKAANSNVAAAPAKKGEKAATEMSATEMSAAEKIKVVDTNQDGLLSAEEHVAGSKRMFEKMDGDKDGFLTKAELDAGHAKFMSPSRRSAPGQ